MTDAEFDVLDELYFVIPFADLLAAAGLAEAQLCQTLQVLHGKGWIRCFYAPDEEVPAAELDLGQRYADYFYLATKKGLQAHTSR